MFALKSKSARLAEIVQDYDDLVDFGNDLANIMERRPEMAIPVVNERVSAYKHLAQLGRIVGLFNINFVIDAGAHSGQFASTLYGYGLFKGEVHSFEPVRKYYDAMKVHESYWPGWKVYNLALGDDPGVTHINVGEGHGGTSSLLAESRDFGTFVSGARLGAKQEVEVKRVDQIFASVLDDREKRVMLKLDVQGFEARVLRSCGERLDAVKTVHVELSALPLYEGQARMSEISTMLEDRGFSLVHTTNNFGIRDAVYLDFDFTFVRTEELKVLKP